MAFGQPQLCLVANIVAIKKGVTKKSFYLLGNWIFEIALRS